MQQQVTHSGNVLTAIAQAKAALAAGRLADYRPLDAAVGASLQQTPMASWGPMMKR